MATIRMFCYVGADVSLNHGAVVRLHFDSTNSCIVSTEQRFFTQTKKWALCDLGGDLHPKKDKGDESDNYNIRRLLRVYDWCREVYSHVPSAWTYVAIEGYAYGRENQAHQLGEVGAVNRLAIWENRLPFRIHDPTTVKLFATGKGNASKNEMRAAVSEQWSYPPKDSQLLTLPAVHQEDLADAYALARMTTTEHQLRTGAIRMSDLPEHQIRAFNRVTKGDTNILAKDWILDSRAEREV